MRTALPNARVLIHQPHGGAQGQSVDMEIQVKETVDIRELMVDILVVHRPDRERIVADIDRDYIVRGQAAVDYGLIDEIVTAREVDADRPARPEHRPRTRPNRLTRPAAPRHRRSRSDWTRFPHASTAIGGIAQEHRGASASGDVGWVHAAPSVRVR